MEKQLHEQHIPNRYSGVTMVNSELQSSGPNKKEVLRG